MKTYLILLMVALFCMPLFLHAEEKNPHVVFKTELGDITVEIYVKQAPITAANFLKYVDENRYPNATFYRVVRMDNQPKKTDDVKIEVIQGGIRYTENAEALPTIKHETTDKIGVLHEDGVISMARTDPGTACSEIFICIGDQPSLDFGGKRHPDGQGFASFGKVVSGMDVVKKIQQQPAEGQMLIKKVVIHNIVRVE